MFGNWDLNSLVDSAASLVTDAQNDLASWEKRDEEAPARPSQEPEGEGAGEWSFDALSGITDALKRVQEEGTGIEQLWGDAALPELPDIAAYLNGEQEPATAQDGVPVTELAQPASSALLPEPSASATAFAASIASRAGEAADLLRSKDANAAHWNDNPSSPAKRDHRVGDAEEQPVADSRAENESMLVGVQARAASPPAVSAALSPERNPFEEGDTKRHSRQQRPRPTVSHQDAMQSSSKAYGGPGGPAREEEQQQPDEQWETLLNGTAGDGWQDADAEATPAQQAIADDWSHASHTAAPVSGWLPGAATAAAFDAQQPDASARSAHFATELQRDESRSTAQLPPGPATDSAALRSRSRDLATALELANGGPEDQPSASVSPAVQGSAANGDATPRALANGPAALDPVALDDGAHARLSAIERHHDLEAKQSRPQPLAAAQQAALLPPPAFSTDVASAGDLEQRLRQLQEALAARELQLERKSDEVSQVQAVCDQLQQAAHDHAQKKNEELAQRASAVSEADLETARQEFETRLAASDRKVYALSKERDALRRGNEKLGAIQDLLKEKDDMITQVMEEGERLSKKQLAQESTIKKLRATSKEVAAEKARLEAQLAQDQGQLAAMRHALETANSSLQAAQEAHRAELQREKQHYEDLLSRARASQVEAERKAAVAAQEGTAKRLRDAESRCESLEETVEELRVAMDRQRAAADMREERLKREVADMERRSQEAEVRHEELSAKLPEATRPLLRQMEAMQAAAAAQAEAWAAAERHLTQRAGDAEAQAASATERERLAVERLQAAQSRVSTVSAALEAARAEVSDLSAVLDAERRQAAEASRVAARAEEQMHAAASSASALRDQLKQAGERAAQKLEAQRAAAEQQLAAAEARVAELQARLRAAEARMPEAQPPAMAAPGYRWVLLKEGQDPARDPGPTGGDRTEPAPAPAPSGGSEPGYLAAAGIEGGLGRGPELDRLRDMLRHRDDQLASLRDQLRQLESTRDSLAEELVAASQAADTAQSAHDAAAAAKAQAAAAEARLAACAELLGEKEERLEELRADMEDVRQLYRDQFLRLLDDLDAARTPASTPVASPARALPFAAQATLASEVDAA